MNEKELLSFWGLSFAERGDDLLISGSPNRTESRFLFRDGKNISYIAEGCKESKKTFRIRQNLLLEYFAANSLEGVYPFLRTLSGEHGVIFDGLFWQIRPYIAAENLPRNVFAEKKEFGEIWGDFLLQMKEIMEKHSSAPLPQNPPFSMANFLPDLFAHAERKMPSILNVLHDFEHRLAPFFQWERKTESMFAHGDFHPGNILTENGKIKTVIDWEFAGRKFPGYDAALLIGCLAMDHPDNLFSPAVQTLQKVLYRNNFMSQEAWDHFPQMVAASRFGWLGEWLTLEEEAFVRQELTLISMLLAG